MDLALAEAPNGQVITEVIHTGARDAAYRNTYQGHSFGPAPPAAAGRRPKWPRIPGTLCARVTSPGQYKYAYLTQQGHYTVRFDLDFDTWPKGGESVPLALAKPFAGARQTGFHFPLVDGTYVDVAFRDGNPNKPYIAHVQHNSQHEDLITNRDRWLSRNVIRTQSNNKLRFEDWEGQEGVKLSTDFARKSQLNLGCLVDGKRQTRGEGFELRTSGWGAIRGGKGLFLSADDQPSAKGPQPRHGRGPGFAPAGAPADRGAGLRRAGRTRRWRRTTAARRRCSTTRSTPSGRPACWPAPRPAWRWRLAATCN